MSIDDIARDFERSQGDNAIAIREEQAIADMPDNDSAVGYAIDNVKRKIIEKSVDKISADKIIEKHSDNLATISDKALEVEADRQRLIVEKVNADNKVVEQEIKNKLIVLNAEAKRLKKEQRQLDILQKVEHKKQRKAKKWEIYGDKLTELGYSYLPNVIVLNILLFFQSMAKFFDGLNAVGTAIVKALKWVIFIALIISLLFIIPVTREWLLDLLGVIK